MKLQELLEQQGRIATQMRALVEKAEKEDRDLTGDELTEWNSRNTAFEELDARIERARKMDGIDEQAMRTLEDYNLRNNPAFKPGDKGEGRGQFDNTQKGSVLSESVRRAYDPAQYRDTVVGTQQRPAWDDDDYVHAFRSYLRGGDTRLSPELRSILETRAPQTVTTTGGGYTVPRGFNAMIEVALKQFSGIRRACTVWPTESGNPVDWPTVNDTGTTGRLLGINTIETDTAIAFGTMLLEAYKYSSDTVLVPIELAQDTGINLDALVARLLGERVGRIQATHLATGTGSSQPRGLSVAATSGKTAASATVFTYLEILDLIHSVDEAYRISPSCGFVFNDTTLKALKQLQDETGSNRPLWSPNIATAVPATIDGFPYTVDNAMPTAATTTKPIVFGDLSKYMIRDVMGVTLTVLRELYAGYHQIGYVSISRMDADLLDAGTNPVKALTMA